MKLLLAILLFYINYVICNSDTRKYAVKSYPKKVKPFGAGKILINSGKYVINPEGRNNTYVTVSPTNTFNDFYTVFQIVGNSKIVHGVPDSPYFPVDQTIEQKPRVKKVLPHYVWSRHKRSADDPKKEVTLDPVTINDDKKEKLTTTPQPSSTTEKPTIVNETPKFRSSNKTEDKTGAKKELIKVTKGHVNHTTSKAQTKNDKKDDKIDAMVALSIKVSKPNNKGTKQSNKTNETRSKTKSKSKNAGRNGTVTKKPKHKQSVKRQGRPKSKTKQSKKNAASRQPKRNQSNTTKAKHAKKDKAPKKQPERKGNSTNVKISKETRRLTSAREALIEDYPYVVSIQKNDMHWCSGALLNPRLVITTANCLWKSNRLSRMSIRAGSSFTDHGGQLANIQEVMKHPRWGLRKNPDNDLALLLLDRNIRFSHSVHAVDLPNRVMMPAFEDAWVTSWGAERRDGIYTPYENALQVYHAYLISSESCNNITRRFGITVSQNFVCFSQSGKTAPCTRDTGAPAVSDGVLWGLASWGIRKLCGTERFPAMFSYTASHSNMDFITNATSYLMSEQRHYPFIDRAPAVRKDRTTTTKATTEYR